MNVILDIDETFVQYVGIDDWNAIPAAERDKYETGPIGKSGLFIIRPHFNEFFDYLFKNAETVNLWTWSDSDYAQDVADIVHSRVKSGEIAHIWAEEDAKISQDLHGHSKDLNHIWYGLKLFNPCDTILIDDLPANTQTSSNIKNGVQIVPFHPLGERLGKSEQTRTRVRAGPYVDMSADDTLLRVIELLRGVAANPEFCSEGDLPHPFKGSTKVMGGRRKKYRLTKRRKARKTTRKHRR